MERTYLISFLANIQGNKMVVQGLQSMQQATGRTTKTAQKSSKATKDLSGQLKSLAGRAMLVVPVWLLLRSVFMGIIRTITGVISANLDLEDGLARIQTVMQGTGGAIKSEMGAIKMQILDMATRTNKSLKELSEAFYFLKTASLDLNEAQSAFVPTVNAMVATGVGAKEMARAVAGVFNTMGKQMDSTLTTAEKFTKIADVLTFTFATQDVEMSELIGGYTKLAPFVGGLSDSFTDLITIIGFLNTRMLRGGRTGRLTARTILQLTKNSHKLSKIFGITFATNEPISFLNTMIKLREVLGQNTKLTFLQQKALQQVFATRGAVSPRLLLESFDGLIESLENARTHADGFAEKLREIRMDTVRAQAGRLQNILAVLAGDFMAGATGAGDYARTLKILNENLLLARDAFNDVGFSVGWAMTQLSMFTLMTERLMKSFGKDIKWWEGFIMPVTVIKRFQEYKKSLTGIEFETPTEYFSKMDKELKKVTKEREKGAKLLKDKEKIQELSLKLEEEEKTKLTHQIKLMKIRGAGELEIARYKLEALKTSDLTLEADEESLKYQKARNELIEAETSFRQKIVDTFRKTELNILKAMGATELQILDIEEKHLNIQYAQNKNEEYQLKMAQLRQRQALAVAQAKQRELAIATNLAMQYQKADKFERGRIRRMMELRLLSPEKLAKEYKGDMFDQKIIEQYWNSFSEQGRLAVGDVIQRMYGLSQGAPAQPGMPTIPEKLLPTDESVEFWRVWAEEGKGAVKTFEEYFRGGFGRAMSGFFGEKGISAMAYETNITTPIESIHVHLPENSLERMAEDVGNKVTNRLKEDETLQKALAKLLRPYI